MISSSQHLEYCYRCNDDGACLRCKCVKQKSRCVNCLPLKRGHYQNAPFNLTNYREAEDSSPSPVEDATVSVHHFSVSMLDSTQSTQSTPSAATMTPSLNHVEDAIPPLPLPVSAVDQNFVWGVLDGASFVNVMMNAFAEVVHWRKQFFQIPNGQVGKEFVSELARLFRCYADNSALESVALKAVTVCCVLLLQRPHVRANTWDCITCLSRRLDLWSEGQIDALLSEGRSIQQRLYSHHQNRQMQSKLVRSFTDLMFLCNTKQPYVF